MWRTVRGRHASQGLRKLGPCNGRSCGHRPQVGKFRDLDGDFRKLPSSQALYPSYKLAVAENAAKDNELPELPQVIIYAMLLNEAERFGVLHGRALRTLESALTELHWSTFELWVWMYGDRIFEARFRTKAAPEGSSEADLQEEGLEVERCIHPLGGSDTTGEEGRQRTIGTLIFPFMMAFSPFYNTWEMADYVREFFIWHWRRATRPPCPLPQDYHVLCLRFSLPEAEGVAVDFELPEMMQATFYAMLLNEVVEWGITDVPQGLINPQVEGRHLQFPCIPAFIDDRAVAASPERINVGTKNGKNQVSPSHQVSR
ncbi:hypothetical protein Cgig2_021632 [Carnegiea gigantea]|uniref:Uncharacterized protein n=1 Tax=Carnegiea gigantea TaxID=171969 RepID=A0A9Q1JPE6_9CARY|nr:hypothetical protein Cgig2_021632 [Carnegiea gigantea]